MKRQIIEINEEKCIGCGLCANACHQGAIQIIDGKAKLVSDSYCDGLGMCLPSCPVDAIKLVEKDTVEFDQSRKDYAVKQKQHKHSGGCPGSANRILKPASGCNCSGSANEILNEKNTRKSLPQELISELRQWPVQLKLVSPMADFWDGADVLIAADCCAYAYGNFHQDFIKDHVTAIGCPKLDDNQYYIQKLTEIFKLNDIKSITVTRMSVPCCGGIVHAIKTALGNTGKTVPYREIIISPDGSIVG